MTVQDAISARRSIKRFDGRPVPRDAMEALLGALVAAPNHRLTNPWRLYVLGPDARLAYGRVVGVRKGRKLEDPEAGRVLAEKVAEEHRGLPAMLAVAITLDDNPDVREEDYAAAMMGVENLALLAVEMGLGTHIKTGAVMDDPGARAAVGVGDRERIVAVINVGYPAEIPPPKARASAQSVTAWIP